MSEIEAIQDIIAAHSMTLNDLRTFLQELDVKIEKLTVSSATIRDRLTLLEQNS